MDELGHQHYTMRHAGDSKKRVTFSGTNGNDASAELQRLLSEPQDANMEYESTDVLVDGNGTSETLEIAVGDQLAGSKQHGRASAIALHSQTSGAAESGSRFRVFSVNIDYRERYPALAGFEKLIHDHGYDTLLKPYDYTTTPERLHFIAYCLMLPEAFDAEHFLREPEACSEWLMTLDFGCRIDSNTEEQDKGKFFGYHSFLTAAISRAQAFTGSATSVTRPLTYIHEQIIQALPHQVPQELFRQPVAPGEVFAHPSAALQTLPKLPLSNRAAGLEPVQPTERSLYPGFVYVVGFSNGTPQDGLRGHSKSGSLQELHSDAPPESFNIGTLGILQVSTDEMCAFFPLHYTWHAFMERLLGAEYGSGLIARLMVYYRGYEDKIRGSALRQRIEQQKKHHINKGKDYNPTSSFSTGLWEAKIGSRKTSNCAHNDWNVVNFAKGVVRLPTGPGRRHLTMAIEHAKAEDSTELMLSDLPAYIKMYGIGSDLPDMAAYIEHPDITARATFQEAVHAADPSRTQQRLKKMRL